MDIPTFRAQLAQLGWKQAEFARRAEVEQDTVTRWCQRGYTAKWVAGFLAPRIAVAALYAEACAKKPAVPELVSPNQGLERAKFEGYFPSAAGLWQPDLNHGHGGYSGGINDTYWMGWITRTVAQLNGHEAMPLESVSAKKGKSK